MIGDPVQHSLSPALHNAAFAALGLDWVYVAFPVVAGDGAAAVAAMRTLGLAGLSVTMPHKASVVAAVDQLRPTAARLGVANTIGWAAGPGGDLLEAESTDGGGFLDALKGDTGLDPAGRTCLVLGAGGAGRAVVLALADAGAASVVVAARRLDAAAAAAALAGAVGSVAEAGPSGLADAVSGADLVVNATPVGMTPGDGLPLGLDPGLLGSRHLVADLIYAPASTPLVTEGRARGATTVNGLGMLIHQAGRQFEMWTGRPAPLEAMSAAALRALAHEG